ncbi:MAG: hypothetical protein VCE43_15065 [Myxococcota bacterium]
MLTDWIRLTVGSLALLPIVLAPPADAKLMAFEGTLSFAPLGVLRTFSVTGSGIATVNAAGADTALNTLSLAPGGIAGVAVVPVTDPEVTNTIASIQLSGSLGAGVLHPFSAAVQSQPLLTQNILPLVGVARVCLVVAGCGSSRQIFAFQHGAAGIGVGGVWSGSGFSYGNRVSVHGAPWTVGTAFLPYVTPAGDTVSIPEFGDAHGPGSFAGSTALIGGVIQLVTPVVVTSGSEISPFSMFAKTTIRFIPEPGMGLLLLSGIVGLVVIGRGRART